jgi:O-antigen ligase
MTGNKIHIIFDTAIFGILCFVTLFITSGRFVNPQITPKWFGLALCVGLAGLVRIFSRQKSVKMNAAVWCLFLIAGAGTALTRSRDLSLWMNTVCLLLLLFLWMQTVERFVFKYIAVIFICFAVALSVHGILQYFGILASENGNFPVTGSFDNPAGYAAALACMLPFCFLSVNDKTTYRKYAATAVAALVLTALFLSGSRAGMLAGLVVLLVYSGVRYIPKKWSNRLKIILVCIIIALPAIFYLFGKNSADGRLLIWRCTWDMICDSPVTGHGQGAFQAKYMLYQADYFTGNPDSKYAALADNVLHPFNEYLLVLAEHGLIGLAFPVLLGFLLFLFYRKERGEAKRIALMSLLALAVLSCFSYPFKYPFTWAVFLLDIAIVCPAAQMIFRRTADTVKAVVAVMAVCLVLVAVHLIRAETTWNRIARQSLAGHTEEMLPEYDKLYSKLGSNGLFLYNHAAELHEAKDYKRSLAVFERCTAFYNDMDVQMLLADNCRELKLYGEAERHLKLAAAMCPVRFMPLYQLVELYRETERTEEAVTLARQILNKEIKIPSSTVNAIRNKMNMLIGEQETLYDSATESGTEVEQFNSTKPGQDDLSESDTPKGLVPP